MITRISTSQVQQQGVALLQRQQLELARVREQLADGRRLRSAADDPAAFASALGIQDTLGQVTQFQQNVDRLSSQMQLAESTLGRVTDTLHRVRELAIAAGSPAVDAEQRASLASQVLALRDELLALANTRGADGRHLFGGTADAAPPFALDGGTVRYLGDQRARAVGVAPGERIAAAPPGSEIFLRVPSGDGIVRAQADAANRGAAVLQGVQATDAAALAGGPWTVSFSAGTVTVTDAAGSIVDSRPWQPGEIVAVPGANLRLAGEPADGDRFQVEAAPARSIFDTVQALADALSTGGEDEASRTARANAVFTTLQDLITATGHVTDLRAGIGVDLQRLDGVREAHEAALVQLQETLGNLQDTDMVEAVTRLQAGLANLEVAQQAYLRVQNLSLFRLLG